MNKVTRRQGRYYLGDANEQACYTFQFREDAPSALERSFIISLDHDRGWSGYPLEVITEIVEMWEDFFIAPQLRKAIAVMDYLKTWEKQDKIDCLTEEKKRIELRIAEIIEELETLVEI
ncbi:hypothetical protein [Paenibacillus sp. FSL H3-0333]|uniref:hypothetical protein n=1 Tax=Paenibacillus sp. FSL H3-0333 TaxID=2921373 RepID=UPI0030F98B07